VNLYICYGTCVPLLVTDEGEAIQGSGKIFAWAQAHPAAAAA
jgi:hypothetical protein